MMPDPEAAQRWVARCRHCGAGIDARVPVGTWPPPWWANEKGFTVCVKGGARQSLNLLNGRPGPPLFFPGVGHEPMPAGMPGAPEVAS